MLTAKAAPRGSKNNYGINDVSPLEFGDSDSQLTTKVYHGVSICAGETDEIVGRIQSWQPDAYTREGVHLYEVSNLHWGRPVEYVPGKATGYTIAVTRAEVWDGEMERAFGASNRVFDDLMDQNKPFKIREFWLKGAASYQVWLYTGCWFQNKNIDAVTSDGDGITRISATIAYVSRRLTTGG
jgi:hypothetical protein